MFFSAQPMVSPPAPAVIPDWILMDFNLDAVRLKLQLALLVDAVKMALQYTKEVTSTP